MAKFRFVGEYEIRASKKMLYPYLSSANGLAQWLADEVSIDSNNIFTIVWEGDKNKAKMTSHRVNSEVRFDFISGDEDPNYLEFKLNMNEVTEEVFIRVTDYSEMDDALELEELWRGFMLNLKEIVGG